ncbi:MAG TPA: hypothetical protein VM733_04665 [Thermoanaerobaculia bacterium]|nr:hypothetical protein [Thermoanaerobaculia bacterium]
MQLISITGAILVLTAYTAHQLRRLRFRTVTYQLLNLCGGAMLCWAAISTRQAGLILMEGAWTVVSAYGLVRVMRRRAVSS